MRLKAGLACALLAAAVLPVALAVRAEVENQAFVAFWAETRVSKNAGMPDMSAMLQNLPPEALANLPPEVRQMMAGGATRTLNIRLWAPLIAPPNATATVTPPAGLNQGPRLDLELYRPEPREPGEVEEGEIQLPGGEIMPGRFVIKTYWGSSPTVRPGQPDEQVIEWEAMSVEDRARLREQAEQAMAGGEYFYKEGWTTAYWPTERQPGTIAEDDSLHGTFTVDSTYAGNVSIDVPDTVDFLAPVQLTSPDMAEGPELTEPIVFRWQPIDNVLGFFVRAMGMKGREEMIQWFCSEVKPDEIPEDEFMQMADVRRLVQEQIMIPGNSTTVTIPAGIFEGCEFVNYEIIGYGTGTALEDAQPRPRVQTRTVMSGLLTSMMGPGMMGGFGDAGH